MSWTNTLTGMAFAALDHFFAGRPIPSWTGSDWRIIETFPSHQSKASKFPL